MSAHWAAPGVKCVCLNSDWRKGRSLAWGVWLRGMLLGWPVHGGVYEIRKVCEFDGEVRIGLKGWPDVLFHIAYFRPLVPSQQQKDVALFAPLLDLNHPRIPATEPTDEVVS